MTKKQPISALTLYEKMGIKDVSALNSDQILHIMQKTPADHIYTRPAKGGGTWDFVTGVYVEKVLNYAFGWNWDFEIKSHGREGNCLWVLGRLTVRALDGKTIVKEQFGRAEIKFKKNTNDPLDYGNDLKAAATDSEKKCASKLGIASDIYGKNEFREIKTREIVVPEEIAKDKETQRIITHINDSKTIEELSLCEDALVDEETRKLFDDKLTELEAKK